MTLNEELQRVKDGWNWASFGPTLGRIGEKLDIVLAHPKPESPEQYALAVQLGLINAERLKGH